MPKKGALGIEPQELVTMAGLKQGHRVADFGCGSHGTLVFEAARASGKHGRVYAVDIQRSVLEAIKSKRKMWPEHSNIELVWSNVEMPGKTAIPAASLDAAFLINVLNQSKHQDKILAEVTRLLKAQGTLIVVDWERLDVPFAPQGCCPPHPDAVKEMAAAAGLRLDSTFPTSEYHFGFKFLKNPVL